MSPAPGTAAARHGLSSDRRLRVCVLVATFRRPAMLGELLDSFTRLAPPDNCEIVFVVVDNDAEASARSVFLTFADRIGRQGAHFFVEEDRGIASARNRALHVAASLHADLGVFIDDDETADTNWLAELVSAYRDRRWVLTGGPVQPIPWSGHTRLSTWQTLVFNGVKGLYRRRAHRAERLTRRGRHHKVAITTNNWLIDLHWLSTTQLQFDRRQSSSGGSDMHFFSEARARGASSGWCPSAIVYALTPDSRLSLRHQFLRARNQSNAAFARKNAHRSRLAAALTLATCVRKAIVAVGWLTVVPFRPGPAVVGSTQAAGWIAGRLDALAGRPPRLYERTDGG